MDFTYSALKVHQNTGVSALKVHQNTGRGECVEKCTGIQAGVSALKMHQNTGGECAESAPEHRQG